MEFYFLFFSLGHHFYIKTREEKGPFKTNLLYAGSPLMILQNSTSKKKTFQMTTLHLGWAIRICTTNNILKTRLQEFPKAITITRARGEAKSFLLSVCEYSTTTVLNLFSVVWQFSVFLSALQFFFKESRSWHLSPVEEPTVLLSFYVNNFKPSHCLLDHFLICIGLFLT